jgi:hypothetical protein
MAVQPARGEIEFNPILFDYHRQRVNPERDMRAQLGQEVQLHLYDAFIPYLKELGSDLQVRFSGLPP